MRDSWRCMGRTVISCALVAGALLTGSVVCLQAGQTPPQRREFVNGFPRDPQFFPIGVWLQNPARAASYRAMGINTYVGLAHAPTPQQLEQLDDHGLYLIVEQAAEALALPKAHVIRAWLQSDEPDNAQPDGRGGYGDCVAPAEIVRRYEAIRAGDPTRPVFLNFGQAVANATWFGRGTKCSQIPPATYYSNSAPGADILSFDIYPAVEDRQKHVMGKLELVGQGVANLRRWSSGQPVWNAIETTHINHASRRPQPEEIRSEVWMALIHGSGGIFYFVHEWKPSFREDAVFRYPDAVLEITRINDQIKQLAPVLNSPTVAGPVRVQGPIEIATMVKRYGGALYLFAVNMEKKAAKARLFVGDIAEADVVVLGEDRIVKLKAGVIDDEFSEYGVRLYKIPGKG